MLEILTKGSPELLQGGGMVFQAVVLSLLWYRMGQVEKKVSEIARELRREHSQLDTRLDKVSARVQKQSGEILTLFAR